MEKTLSVRNIFIHYITILFYFLCKSSSFTKIFVSIFSDGVVHLSPFSITTLTGANQSETRLLSSKPICLTVKIHICLCLQENWYFKGVGIKKGLGNTHFVITF